MKERWVQLQETYEGLVVRERVLLLCACLAALYGAADMLLLHPMDLEGKRLRTELERSVEAIERLGERSKLLAKQIEAESPGEREREEKMLERQLAIMSARIQELMSSMIPPDQVARMLEELLSEESGLTLIKLASVDPATHSRAIGAEGANASAEASGPSIERAEFYRHGFVIELEGTYFAALHYLESIESLPWDLSWDRITYEVTDYPRARISIELHTLSREENWIGV